MIQRAARLLTSTKAPRPSAPDQPQRTSYAPPRAETLGEFWALVHEPHLRHGRKGTHEQHAYRWSQWIAPTLARRRWAELDAQAIADWLAMLRSAPRRGALGDGTTPLAASTVINFFATLSAILGHAVALGYLAHNPCGPVRRYLPEKQPAGETTARERAYTLEQTRALLASREIALDRRSEFAFAVYTCCRRGEVHGLRWGDLHDATSTEPAHVVIQRSHGGPTKSGRSRKVPLHSELRVILRAHRARWTERYGRAPVAADLVFPERGGHMRTSNAGGEFGRIVQKAGLPRLTYHGLRHTGATLYRAAGVNRDDCAAILGHALAQVTDLYAPPQLPLLALAIERLKLAPELEPPPPPPEPDEPPPDTERDHAPGPTMTKVSGKQAISGQPNKELDARPGSTASVFPMPHPSTGGGPARSDSRNQLHSGPPAQNHGPARAGADHALAVQCDADAGYHADELAALLGADTRPNDADAAEGVELAALMGWHEGTE